jgi:hypothetical protein
MKKYINSFFLGLLVLTQPITAKNYETPVGSYVLGAIGITTAGLISAHYIYSVTPAGCIKEYKDLFGLHNNPNWAGTGPVFANKIISDLKNNGWPFLGWTFLGYRSYSYHKVAEYLSALSDRFSMAKRFFGDTDKRELESVINHLELMISTIVGSQNYKDEEAQMSRHVKNQLVQVQGSIAQGVHKDTVQVQGSIAQGVHKDTGSYLVSRLGHALWDYSGTGAVGLAALYGGYKLYTYN